MYLDYGKYNSQRFVVETAYKARRSMFETFMELVCPTSDDLILDVGVTPNNTPVGNNFFEKMYPYTANITMCTIEDASNLEREFPGTRFVRSKPGKQLPFLDKQFEVVFCSAVIEHVGSRKQQYLFLKELLRVGNRLFLTTPNKNFPVELHTCLPLVHLLPQKMHQRILSALGMKFYAKTQNLNLLNRKHIKKFMSEMKKGKGGGGEMEYTILYYRLFGLASNIILYCRAGKESGIRQNP